MYLKYIMISSVKIVEEKNERSFFFFEIPTLLSCELAEQENSNKYLL